MAEGGSRNWIGFSIPLITSRMHQHNFLDGIIICMFPLQPCFVFAALGKGMNAVPTRGPGSGPVRVIIGNVLQ